jgi:hypothetical protein
MIGASMNNLHLSSENLTYLLTVLRNSNHPVTTQQLVEALRERAK